MTITMNNEEIKALIKIIKQFPEEIAVRKICEDVTFNRVDQIVSLLDSSEYTKSIDIIVPEELSLLILNYIADNTYFEKYSELTEALKNLIDVYDKYNLENIKNYNLKWTC
jgi:hypothetical protein